MASLKPAPVSQLPINQVTRNAFLATFPVPTQLRPLPLGLQFAISHQDLLELGAAALLHQPVHTCPWAEVFTRPPPRSGRFNGRMKQHLGKEPGKLG